MFLPFGMPCAPHLCSKKWWDVRRILPLRTLAQISQDTHIYKRVICLSIIMSVKRASVGFSVAEITLNWVITARINYSILQRAEQNAFLRACFVFYPRRADYFAWCTSTHTDIVVISKKRAICVSHYKGERRAIGINLVISRYSGNCTWEMCSHCWDLSAAWCECVGLDLALISLRPLLPRGAPRAPCNRGNCSQCMPNEALLIDLSFVSLSARCSICDGQQKCVCNDTVARSCRWCHIYLNTQKCVVLVKFVCECQMW